jgi:CRP-like cAMP-binding protein
MKPADETLHHPAKVELRSLLQRQAPYFGLTVQAIDELVHRARIEQPRRTVCVSGDDDDLINLVIRGVVRVDLVVPHVGTMIFKFLGRGEVFCLTPTHASGSYHLRAVAHEPATVAVWTKENLARAIAMLPIPSVMQFLTTSWLHLSRLAEGRCLLRILPLEQRVILFLRRLARRHGVPHPRGTLIDLRLLNNHIGQLVGASRSTISRRMAALERRGVLERNGDRIVLLQGANGARDVPRAVEATT